MNPKPPPVTWGTLGGTVASALPSLYAAQLLEAILLAGVGAVVSFFTSCLLKQLMRRYRKKRRK